MFVVAMILAFSYAAPLSSLIVCCTTVTTLIIL
jgi:hypothetical protein